MNFEYLPPPLRVWFIVVILFCVVAIIFALTFLFFDYPNLFMLGETGGRSIDDPKWATWSDRNDGFNCTLAENVIFETPLECRVYVNEFYFVSVDCLDDWHGLGLLDSPRAMAKPWPYCHHAGLSDALFT